MCVCAVSKELSERTYQQYLNRMLSCFCFLMHRSETMFSVYVYFDFIHEFLFYTFQYR